jgi:hypothetical protein
MLETLDVIGEKLLTPVAFRNPPPWGLPASEHFCDWTTGFQKTIYFLLFFGFVGRMLAA